MEETFLKTVSNYVLYSSLCLMLGGILAIIPILPPISNFFPIYTYFSSIDIIGTSTGSVSFWGIRHSTVSPVPNPSGWAPLGISPLILIFIFATLGIIGIILSINKFLKFLPSNKVWHIPNTNITGFIAGFIILFLDLLIFFGNALDPTKIGLSETLQTSSKPVAIIIKATPGLGYWFLVLSGLLIITGSILNEINESNWTNQVILRKS